MTFLIQFLLVITSKARFKKNRILCCKNLMAKKTLTQFRRHSLFFTRIFINIILINCKVYRVLSDPIPISSTKNPVKNSGDQVSRCESERISLTCLSAENLFCLKGLTPPFAKATPT